MAIIRHFLVCFAIILLVACGRSPSPQSPEATPASPTAPPPPPPQAPPGMVWIPGGTFMMGSDYKPIEGPIHEVTLSPFFIDTTEVTNAQFAEFVAATNYITMAEKVPTLESLPGVTAEVFSQLVNDGKIAAGANNFRKTEGPVDLRDELQWWEFKKGADWRHPDGPGSTIDGKQNYPVVCVSWFDAAAYAKWAGKRLPTEAEWEFAARGGLVGKQFVWGDEIKPNGQWSMNTWQGEFPHQNLAEDHYEGLSPARSFPANGYGLYDMAGNVWEWTADFFHVDYYKNGAKINPKGPDSSEDPEQPPGVATRVIRGGSWLCNDCYCEGYRPAARMRTTPDTSSNHMGFRCVKDVPASARQQ